MTPDRAPLRYPISVVRSPLQTQRPQLRVVAGGLERVVKPLSDDEKYAALSQQATARGFCLKPEVIRYIVAHYPRDLPALMNLLAALDLYSLQRKRPITVPLLKQVIDQEEL